MSIFTLKRAEGDKEFRQNMNVITILTGITIILFLIADANDIKFAFLSAFFLIFYLLQIIYEEIWKFNHK